MVMGKRFLGNDYVIIMFVVFVDKEVNVEVVLP